MDSRHFQITMRFHPFNDCGRHSTHKVERAELFNEVFMCKFGKWTLACGLALIGNAHF